MPKDRSTPLPLASPATLFGAVQFDMASKISGRTYRILVFKPASPPPPAGYPVLVVTDGAMMFPLAATQSATAGMFGRRTCLVVGVSYPGDDMWSAFRHRNRDLTPPTPLSRIRPQPGQPPVKAENYGGSDEFRRFLVEELRPAIAAAYPVDPDDQTLYGHSLGGLFALTVLFDHPQAFRAFVASSPSIWWNRRAVLKAEADFARRICAREAQPRVLIVVGAREQEPPPTTPPGMTRAMLRRLIASSRMVDNARELAGRLAAIKGGPGYEVRFCAFEDEDHGSVIPATISRALGFALGNQRRTGAP